MNKENVTTLAELGTSRVVKFEGCEHIGIFFKNLLLYFTVKNYLIFASRYQSIKFSHHSLVFPDNKSRMILNTPLNDVQFCFTRDEYEGFKQLLLEASILIKANQIINSKD